MRARHYDPTVGRFISEDPIGLEGGINPYTFGDGEPVNRADPSGLECVEWGGFREVEVSPGHTVYYPKCAVWQLDAMAITAPQWTGFRSSRGGGIGGEGGNSWSGGGGSSGLQKAADFAAGFGDFVSFGFSKAVREAWDCADCVNYQSGLYTAGQVTGGVVGVAEGGLVAARLAGWTSRVAVHGAHHSFPVIGRAAHVQVNMWKIGAKGSGFTVVRVPIWPF
jgi:hypothetical protein